MNRFNAINTETRFIKNLLKNTYLPLYPAVTDGDLLVSGAIYSYKDKIIKCIDSGSLNTQTLKYCDITSICGPTFICNVGIRKATYEQISIYSTNKLEPGINSNILSHLEYYDSDTHKHLGNYLRWYRSIYGIDLMPFYNCFTNKSIDNLYLDSHTIQDKQNSKYTLWAIPINLNKEYTIFIESSSPVRLKGAFLNDANRITTKDVNGNKTPLDSLLNDYVQTYSNTTYKQPIKYNTVTTNSKLICFNNLFYLLLQVDNTHSGSIVVLEGDYKEVPRKIITSSEILNSAIKNTNNTHKDIDYGVFKPKVTPSITQIQSSESIPYSDRLIEFLTENSITNNEDIPKNISRIYKQINNKDMYNLPEDTWHPLIKYLLYNKYFNYTNNNFMSKSILTEQEELNLLDKTNLKDKLIIIDNKIAGFKNMKTKLSTSRNITDISGYVDKDIENFIYKYRGL